jgi:hypothetical protein
VSDTGLLPVCDNKLYQDRLLQPASNNPAILLLSIMTWCMAALVLIAYLSQQICA